MWTARGRFIGRLIGVAGILIALHYVMVGMALLCEWELKRRGL